VYSADNGACPVCYQRDNCPCGNIKFCDPTYGVFQYCSPSCRDSYLLPAYNKKLQEDLKINPLHDNGSSAGGGFSSTAHFSSHITSTGQASSTIPTGSLWFSVYMWLGWHIA